MSPRAAERENLFLKGGGTYIENALLLRVCVGALFCPVDHIWSTVAFTVCVPSCIWQSDDAAAGGVMIDAQLASSLTAAAGAVCVCVACLLGVMCVVPKLQNFVAVRFCGDVVVAAAAVSQLYMRANQSLRLSPPPVYVAACPPPPFCHGQASQTSQNLECQTPRAPNKSALSELPEVCPLILVVVGWRIFLPGFLLRERCSVCFCSFFLISKTPR